MQKALDKEDDPDFTPFRLGKCVSALTVCRHFSWIHYNRSPLFFLRTSALEYLEFRQMKLLFLTNESDA